MKSVESLIGWEATVGQGSEWHLSFVRGKLHPILKWCIHLSRILFMNLNYLINATAGGPVSPPKAHLAKFYCLLRLIGSVWKASKFSVYKIDWKCNFVGFVHHPFWLQLVFGTFFAITFQLFKLSLLLSITDEGSVPQMCIWPMLLIKYFLKMVSTS